MIGPAAFAGLKSHDRDRQTKTDHVTPPVAIDLIQLVLRRGLTKLIRAYFYYNLMTLYF